MLHQRIQTASLPPSQAAACLGTSRAALLHAIRCGEITSTAHAPRGFVHVRCFAAAYTRRLTDASLPASASDTGRATR